MKYIYLFLFFLLTYCANSQEWDLIQGVNYLTNPVVIEDTLMGFNHFQDFVIFKNKKWDTIDYKTILIESVSDTVLKNQINALGISYSNFFNDFNNGKWIVLSGASDSFRSFIFFDNENKINVYDTYKQIDSINDTKINKVYYISFSNDSVPYFILSNKTERTSFVSLCKLQNNKIIEINKHYSPSSGSSSKSICFDSKNNFWLNNNDSLFYYSNDTISKSFSSSDFPKTNSLQGGLITKVCVDKSDKVYAVSNLFGIYIYDNNNWAVDSLFSTNCFAVSLMWHDNEFQNMELDSKGNLWLYHIMPFLYKRDKAGIWSKYIIPNASSMMENVGSGKCNGYVYDAILIDSKDRIWIYGIYIWKYWIYSPYEGDK